MSLLQHRYPTLADSDTMGAVATLLYTPGAVNTFNDPEIEKKLQEINFETDEIGDQYTADEKARMLCYITTKILITLNTTHCTPLPSNKFKLPWIHSNGLGFVKLDNEEQSESD